MDTTNKSLLIRLRDKADHSAWKMFYDLYSPLIYRYARSRGLAHHDAEDIRSQVLELISRKIESFDYEPGRGGFRSWLRRIVVNKIIDVQRRYKPLVGGSQLSNIAAENDNDVKWETQWQKARMTYCLEQARQCTPQRAYQIFHLLVIEHKDVSDVSVIMDTSSNQIYKAKSLVLSEVRRALINFDTLFVN